MRRDAIERLDADPLGLGERACEQVVDPAAALGVKLAQPDRAVVALIGAGGADWLNDEDEAKKARAADAQKAQAVEAGAGVAGAADVATRVGNAGVAAAAGRQAMQQTGLLQ